MTTVAPIPSAIPAPPSAVLQQASGSSFAPQAQVVNSLPPQQGDKSKDPGLVAPLTRPRIVIPSHAIAMATRQESHKSNSVVPVITPKVVTVTPAVTSSTSAAQHANVRCVENGKEKVGRWSEEEHKVFLEGLGKHGKQWKLIAGMIGTRTVVQVRTHAQKYFQRVERHHQKQGSSGSGGSSVSTSSSSSSSSLGQQQQQYPSTTTTSHAAKRKMSLPASLPSRSNKKTKSNRKASMPRSASISMGGRNSTKSPPPSELMSTHPSYISNDSASSSSDGSWAYTVSPSGVNDMYEQLETLQCLTQEGDMEPQEPEQAVMEQQQQEDVQMYDFNALDGQDPLEWLIDAEPSILPESSLPVFPDLNSQQQQQAAAAAEAAAGEQQQLAVDHVAVAAADAVENMLDQDDFEPNAVVVTHSSDEDEEDAYAPNPVVGVAASSAAADDDDDADLGCCLEEPSSMIVNELNTIADPTMTVQSLFLLPASDC